MEGTPGLSADLPIDMLLGLDLTKPNIARVYDCLLGGTANFSADRKAAALAEKILPTIGRLCRENREFLARSVRYIAQQGVTQFLDIGSGLPTQENVHEVAQRVTSWARVVYVDRDPVVVAHATQLLGGAQFTRIIQGDMTDPSSILGHQTVRRLITPTQPSAVLLLAALHFVSDEDARALISALNAVLAPGSYIAVSHMSADGSPAEMERFKQSYEGQVATATYLRSRGEIAALLAGFELLPPGIVPAVTWRPENEVEDPGPTLGYVAVARKP